MESEVGAENHFDSSVVLPPTSMALTSVALGSTNRIAGILPKGNHGRKSGEAETDFILQVEDRSR